MNISRKLIAALLCTAALLLFSAAGVFAEEAQTSSAEAQASSTADSAMNLVYQAHVSSVGWQPAVTDNEISGTTGKGLPVEAFAISIPEELGTVRCRAHVANVGWQDWTDGKSYAGTVGQGEPMEAIQIKLEGSAAENYDIYYRVHVSNVGWLDWTENGAIAGTTGYALSIEAIQVCYTEKGEPVPGSTICPAFVKEELAKKAQVNYTAHCQNIGWQQAVSNGEISGTTGQSRQLEAVIITLQNQAIFGDDSQILYSLQCAQIGWTPEVSGGAAAGTTGRSLQAEALSARLTGRAASAYDLYYRVHSANLGWLDWAKNGAVAGTTGLGIRAEAIQVCLVPKNAPAPGPTGAPAYTRESLQRAGVAYSVSVQNHGWQSEVSNGAAAGLPEQNLWIEAFSVQAPGLEDGSALTYQACVDGDWQNDCSAGQTAGTTGQNLPVQAYRMDITGRDGDLYDIYYQACCEDTGWLGWAKNGEWSGVTGDCALTGMRVMMLPKNSAAPGSTEGAYKQVASKKWQWPLIGYTTLSSYFGPRPASDTNGIGSTDHGGIDIPAPSGTPIYAVASGTVTLAGWNGGYGNCVIIETDKGEEVYYGHMSSIAASANVRVAKGDIIGYVGSTGWSTGPHLHLGVYAGSGFVDPLNYYPDWH